MAALGKISEFQPSVEDWPQYVERLEFFFAANGITSDDKRRATFLAVIGPTAYKLLQSMLALVKPADRSFEELVKVLSDHYSPKPSELSEGDQLTLTKAQAMETATKDSQLLRPLSVSVQMVKDKRKTRNILCYRYAKPGHSPANCRFQTAKCHKCQKIGHIMRACTAQRPTKAVRQVTHEEALQDDDDDIGIQNAEYNLFNLNSTSNQPFQVMVIVDNQQVPMEIDTGAAVSLVSEETYKKLWPHKPLQQATIVLKTYSGEQLQLCGSMEVDVVYGTQHCTLPLLVIKGNGPSLLGRDWLKHFELDWKAIYTLQRETLEVVLAQHKDVFQEGLGTLNGYSANREGGASLCFWGNKVSCIFVWSTFYFNH